MKKLLMLLPILAIFSVQCRTIGIEVKKGAKSEMVKVEVPDDKKACLSFIDMDGKYKGKTFKEAFPRTPMIACKTIEFKRLFLLF